MLWPFCSPERKSYACGVVKVAAGIDGGGGKEQSLRRGAGQRGEKENKETKERHTAPDYRGGQSISAGCSAGKIEDGSKKFKTEKGRHRWERQGQVAVWQGCY